MQQNMDNLPYNLNSRTEYPVRKCPMSITHLLEGYDFFKRNFPLSKSYEQHRNLVAMCLQWIEGIERVNDIKERFKILDAVKYILKGRFRERRAYLAMSHMVTTELNDIALEKVQEYVDDEGNIIETKHERKMGFGRR